MSKEKTPTTLRAYAEHRAALAKVDEKVSPLGRPRVFSENPLLIKVHLERNLRPINWEEVENYKHAMIRGDQFPPVDVTVENGEIVLRHGYHRTLAAQAAVKECPEMADFQLELREFRGNSVDAIFLMINSQDSVPLDPVSRAEGYMLAYKQLQSYAKVGERAGRKSGEHVAKQLLLCEAEESVKALIRAEKIKASTVIDLITEQKQGGRNHEEVAMEMLANAEASGKTKATPKHRNPESPTNTAPKLKIKDVKRTLTSLGGISEALRSALASHSITEEGLGGEQAEVLVPLQLPAAKLAELLALLDMQAATAPEAEGKGSSEPGSEEQADMFADSASEA